MAEIKKSKKDSKRRKGRSRRQVRRASSSSDSSGDTEWDDVAEEEASGADAQEEGSNTEPEEEAIAADAQEEGSNTDPEDLRFDKGSKKFKLAQSTVRTWTRKFKSFYKMYTLGDGEDDDAVKECQTAGELGASSMSAG